MPSFQVLVLGFLFVSFHPSSLRSHSCSTSACLPLSPSACPLPIRFLINRFSSGSDYSALCFFLSALCPLRLTVGSSSRLRFLSSPVASPLHPRLVSRPLHPAAHTRLSVRFLSPFPASLPTAVPQVLARRSHSGVLLCFRYLSAHFHFRLRLLSLPLFLFRLSPSRLAVASQVPPFPLSLLRLPLPFSLVSHEVLPVRLYSASCSFPFVLPSFAPTAVPLVLPFQVSPPGSTPDFRFLSSASALASHYSASVSSFPFFPFPPHSGFPGARPFLSSPSLSPSVPPVSMLPFRFRYLSFPAVPFSASLLRVTGATLAAGLLFPARPFPLAFALGSGYLACRFELFGSPQTSHILPLEYQKVNTFFVHISTIVLYFATILFHVITKTPRWNHYGTTGAFKWVL